MSDDHYAQQNRRAWNEIADIRSQSFPPATFFAEGGSVLSQRVIEAVADVSNKTLLHLQCATGEETLSWANAGARAFGVDISDAQIKIAVQKASDSRLPIQYRTANVYELPQELQNGTFDYVYTGVGALMWLWDIERWAQVVNAALRPNGKLVLYEMHPITLCLWTEADRLTVVDDYFRRNQPAYDRGWSHFVGGEKAHETKVQFAWPLGDIVTSLIHAGMQIQSLQEYPSEEKYRFSNQLEEAQRLPGMYLLIAQKLVQKTT